MEAAGRGRCSRFKTGVLKKNTPLGLGMVDGMSTWVPMDGCFMNGLLVDYYFWMLFHSYTFMADMGLLHVAFAPFFVHAGLRSRRRCTCCLLEVDGCFTSSGSFLARTARW